MTRRLLLSYVLMAVIILAMLSVPLGINLADREHDRLLVAIERDARILAAEADDAFENDDFTALPGLVKDYVQQSGGRVVMVDATGSSVVDSSDLNGTSRDFSTRPEIISALADRFTTGQRNSTTLGHSLSFVVVPVRHADSVIGAVRVSYPTTDVEERTRRVWLGLLGLDAVTLLVVVATGWLVAGTIGRPIRRLERAADRLASGELDARVAAGGPPDLRRVGRTFNVMADRLQAMIESQRAFVADASHQLRTPLTAMRLRLESLTDSSAELNVQATSDAAAVASEVDRLSELVDSLLVMARLDAQPGEAVEVAIPEIVAERVTLWAPLSDEQGVQLLLDDMTSDARVMAVDGGIEQILDNLIDNAIGHSPQGSKITIAVSDARGTGSPDGLVQLSVADEGPGLSDAQMARMFDRYWRGPDATEHGSGLGLAIVQRLAETSGGTVAAGRNVAGGLTVTISLRRASTS